MEECNCPQHRAHLDYLRGRAEARKILGYSDLDGEGVPFPSAAVTVTYNAGVKRDPPPIAMTTEATCQGCGIPEFSPIGAGPFENGLCRYCSELNAYVPIKPSLARQARPTSIIPLEPKRVQPPQPWVFVITFTTVIVIVYLLGLLFAR